MRSHSYTISLRAWQLKKILERNKITCDHSNTTVPLKHRKLSNTARVALNNVAHFQKHKKEMHFQPDARANFAAAARRPCDISGKAMCSAYTDTAYIWIPTLPARSRACRLSSSISLNSMLISKIAQGQQQNSPICFAHPEPPAQIILDDLCLGIQSRGQAYLLSVPANSLHQVNLSGLQVAGISCHKFRYDFSWRDLLIAIKYD